MSVSEDVRRFILSDLNHPGSEAELTESYPLIEKRVLDSLGIFKMVSFLERRYGIEISDQELVEENFGSIERIAALVDRKTAS